MHSLSQQLIHEGIHGSGIVTGKTRLSPFRRVNGFSSANRATKVHTGAANWVMLGQARGSRSPPLASFDVLTPGYVNYYQR